MLSATTTSTGAARRPLRSRAWWVMRVMPTFTADDLLLAVATGDEGAARNNLVRYLANLEAAKVISRLPVLQRRTPTTWRLETDLRPHAPVVSRIGGRVAVVNPNAAGRRAVIGIDSKEGA